MYSCQESAIFSCVTHTISCLTLIWYHIEAQAKLSHIYIYTNILIKYLHSIIKNNSSRLSFLTKSACVCCNFFNNFPHFQIETISPIPEIYHCSTSAHWFSIRSNCRFGNSIKRKVNQFRMSSLILFYRNSLRTRKCIIIDTIYYNLIIKAKPLGITLSAFQSRQTRPQKGDLCMLR